MKTLTSKQVYEYSKGLRDENYKKIKNGFLITKEILEINQEKLLKQKSISILLGCAINLARRGQNPKLPDNLHNKVIAYRIFSFFSPETNKDTRKYTRKDWHNNYEKRNADKYFEVLKSFEETGKVPMTYSKYRLEYNKDPNVETYTMGWKNRMIINPLSKEQLEILIQNPYYALKYAKCNGRFEKEIEDKFLNSSVTYSLKRKRTKKRNGSIPAEYADVVQDSCEIILKYCNQFGVGLPLVFHNIILWKAANNERCENHQIHMGFDWKNHKLSPEERIKLGNDGFYCRYKRYIKEYNQFVNNLSNFINKKKITKETKIADVLKKRLSKKDRMYFETYVNVQQLDINKCLPDNLFLAKIAA